MILDNNIDWQSQALMRTNVRDKSIVWNNVGEFC